MKLAKSLLLGSAAGFIAVTGAQAADLPTRKAAPVDYVRICTVTDTCIKLGGRSSSISNGMSRALTPIRAMARMRWAA